MRRYALAGIALLAGGLAAVAWPKRRAKSDVSMPNEPVELVAAGRERRYAIVAGSNRGNIRQLPLEYAESDAQKMAEILRDLAGVAPEDALLSLGRGVHELLAAFEHTRRLIDDDRKHTTDNRAVLFFYFSGHSDGVNLELGDETLSFGELYRALADTGATARIAIVDSCKSGSVLGIKGGKLGGGFDTHLLDEIAVTGEALLSSSTSEELSLESREIGGSFFTHYLVSGLRGAADGDGNARVTLGEAYRHAALRTRAATRATAFGPESPSFDYRLVGQGEFNVTDLRPPTPSTKLVAGFDRIVVRDEAHGRIMAEIDLGDALRLALPPGGYRVTAEREQRIFTSRFSLEMNETKALAEGEFTEVKRPALPRSRMPGDGDSFRLGQLVPTPMQRNSPYFCEGVEGEWKGCRGSGCTVCLEHLANYPLYLRNHPNCLPTTNCEGKYFTCSSNCPAPGEADSCQSQPTNWRGCFHAGCGVCAELVSDYPKYFEHHPSCFPLPGRCDGNAAPCSINCPAPRSEDR